MRIASAPAGRAPAACPASISALITASLAGPNLPAFLPSVSSTFSPANSGTSGDVGAVLVDRLGDLAMAVRQPDLVVLGAVAGRGVDEAGAGVVGDVVAGQQRHVEAVARVERRQRMGGDHALRVDRLELQPLGDLGRGDHLVGQLLGQDQHLADLGPGLERQVLPPAPRRG